MYKNIGECVEKLLSSGCLEQKAFSYYKNGKCEISYNFEQYLTLIRNIMEVLNRANIEDGSNLAVLYRNAAIVPPLYLACLMRGIVIVPLNPDYSESELDYVLTNSSVSNVIGDPELLGKSEVINKKYIPIELIAPPDAVYNNIEGMFDALPHVHPYHPAYILYTSGTTAFPKGVVQSHGSIIANALSMIKFLKLERLIQYSIMPFYHSHACGFGLMTTLLCKGHLVMSPAMDPLNWKYVIEKENVNVTSMVPNLLKLLLTTKVKKEDVPSLEFIFVSAAPLPSSLAAQFEAQSGIKLAHGWGMSEFTNFATCINIDLRSEIREKLFYGDKVPTIGQSLPSAEVMVVDESGSEVEECKEGELIIRGPSLMKEYLKNPEATRNSFLGDWLRSGDIGYYRLVNGVKYFFIVGRSKEIIIRSGQKISPVAVESKIITHFPALADSLCALGFVHYLYGEEIGVIIDIKQEDFEEIHENFIEIINRFPVWQRPKVIIVGEKLIKRTHTGKIKRSAVADLFEGYSRVSGSVKVEQRYEEATDVN